MKNRILTLIFAILLVVTASSGARAAATIVIVNNDAAGVGFNDPAARAPVGGNSGTTLGGQRLIAFQAAADKWGATLDSTVNINIRAQWTALTCTSTSAVLGSAGAIQIFRDFAGAPFTGTWYNESLAGKFLAADPDPATPEINANFNVNLGNAGCLDGTPFYLGLDNNHGSAIDLVTVLTHEFGHGLGFQTFTNASTGAYNSGFPSIYDRFLVDLTTGKNWLQMTNSERVASSLKTHKLGWNGPQVQADVPSVLAFGIPIVKINSPAVIAGNYDAGTAGFGPQPTAGGVTGNLILANDGVGTTSDGCEAFSAGFFTANIAVIDRGTCSFKTKTLNAQNAGATAVIIVNNVAGSPAPGLGDDATIVTPITIPTVSLTQPDGNAIKAQLGGTVNGAVKLDMTVRAGADAFGKALLFSPNPFQGGSSVSHWDDIAFPNQLMEPAINGDLTHNVTPPSDLTYSQMRDIGWVASAIPSGISKTAGDFQNTALNQPFAVPLKVTVSPAIAGITVTWTANAGGTGSNGSFSTGTTATSVTDGSGVATAPTLTANGTAGPVAVNATAPGAGTTTFSVLIDPAPLAGTFCPGFADTTQADFQAGVTNNTDVTTSPGNVTLLNPANIDQQNQTLSTSGNGITTTGWAGQTFIPAVTGQLAKVDINLFCAGCTGTTPTVTVSVRNTAAGLPTGADLASVTAPTSISGAGGYFTFNFATPATLTSGTQYALVVRNATNPSVGTNAITRSATDVYASGARVTSPDSGGTWSAQVTDIGFITYMQTGNSPTGDFVSSLKDANPPGSTTWATMTWNATVPANTTLQFQVAGSSNFGGPFNFVGPDGTAGTFFTTSPASLAQFNGKRYLKYKAYFTTTNGTITPTLNDVAICYTNSFAPTAANVAVSGRVLSSGGSGIRGAMVSITDSHGIQRIALTNAFGYYTFDSIPSGDNYVVRASAKRYSFSPQGLSLTDSVSDLNFVDGQ
ncbi:MAG TPA: PA domain-containing protein [Pyrinomonadaceae bacterium]|jgi:hypothetical protein|nr:PA domain-containing protein [Pyrinomonadaceae bacterium]